MVYNDVLCYVVTTYFLYEFITQRKVGPWLTNSTGFLFPILIIKPDSVHELGPRLPKTECRKTVTLFWDDGQNLPEASSPDSAEKLEGEEEVLLVSFLADKDCNASRSDPDVEDSL